MITVKKGILLFLLFQGFAVPAMALDCNFFMPNDGCPTGMKCDAKSTACVSTVPIGDATTASPDQKSAGTSGDQKKAETPPAKN
jgi:hypothetical protein